MKLCFKFKIKACHKYDTIDKYLSDLIILKMQQIQYVENGYSEATKSLVESLPVKEEEKLHMNLVSRQNTCALDMIGLSWIFEDDYS